MLKSDSRMKILFLTRRFFPSIGGVEKHCFEVGKRLVKKGHEVTVVTEGKGGPEETEGIRVYRIPITTGEKIKKFQIWSWLLKNRKIIKNSDIVHCHDIFFWYLPFRFIYPRKKVFTTFHGWEGIYPPTFKSKTVRKLSEKLSFGNICIGDYLEKWYCTNADFITYGGIGINNDKNIKQKKVKELNIIYLGKLEEMWLGIYLRALNILKDRLINFKITFIGEGSLDLEAGKLGRVLRLTNKLPDFINHSNVIFTSGYLSTLESLNGFRVVFAVGENDLKRDIFKLSPFAKWIVIESDPEKLAQKVIDYKEGRLKIDIEGAYNWARTQTWEKVTDLYIKLWKK